jgi:hypothetical protein
MTTTTDAMVRAYEVLDQILERQLVSKRLEKLCAEMDLLPIHARAHALPDKVWGSRLRELSLLLCDRVINRTGTLATELGPVERVRNTVRFNINFELLMRARTMREDIESRSRDYINPADCLEMALRLCQVAKMPRDELLTIGVLALQ